MTDPNFPTKPPEQVELFPAPAGDRSARGRRRRRRDVEALRWVDVGHGLELPAVVAEAGPEVVRVAVEYLVARLRNPNTRQAYARAVGEFLAWADELGLGLADIEAPHVAAYVELLGRELAPASVKQHLSAIKGLFRHLVAAGAVAGDPTAAVTGPRLRRGAAGKTPVLEEGDARRLLGAIETHTVKGLRDRALLSMMATSLARVGAVVRMRVRDFEELGAAAGYRLQEKGGREHYIDAHPETVRYLGEYLEAGGLAEDLDAPLWQSVNQGGRLTGRGLRRQDVLRMTKRRAAAVGLRPDQITCHTWRATGGTDYIAKGGDLLTLQELMGHASPTTTRAYVRTPTRVRRAEILRIQVGIAQDETDPSDR